MQIFPWQPLSKEQVRRDNALFGKRRRFSFSAAEKTFGASLEPPHADFQVGALAVIRLGKERAEMAMASSPPLHLLAPSLGEVDMAGVPEDCRSALLESVLQPAFDQLEKAASGSCVLEELNLEGKAPSGESLCRFLVTDSGGQSFFEGQLYGGEGMSRLMEKWMGNLPAAADGVMTRSIPVRLGVCIGKTVLPADDFQRLAPHDVLLPDIFFPSAGDKCLVTLADGRAFAATLKENKVTVSNTNLMNEPLSPENSGPASEALQALPVKLIFEVGETEISFGDLAKLATGYTFELNSAVERPVTIRANGKAVATGELVAIGDRVGVRILEFHQP